jgi:hypothetical protein
MVSTVRVATFCEALQVSGATGYNYINREKVAVIYIDGITRVVKSWGDNPPPRENRPPSMEELVQELALGEKPPKRRMPAGVHRGRPPRKPAAAE